MKIDENLEFFLNGYCPFSEQFYLNKLEDYHVQMYYKSIGQPFLWEDICTLNQNLGFDHVILSFFSCINNRIEIDSSETLSTGSYNSLYNSIVERNIRLDLYEVLIYDESKKWLITGLLDYCIIIVHKDYYHQLHSNDDYEKAMAETMPNFINNAGIEYKRLYNAVVSTHPKGRALKGQI